MLSKDLKHTVELLAVWLVNLITDVVDMNIDVLLQRTLLILTILYTVLRIVQWFYDRRKKTIK